MRRLLNGTFIRYFFSYLLIFVISVFSLAFVYRSELIDVLSHQFESNVLDQLNAVVNDLDEGIKEMYTVNNAIVNNVDVVLSKYNDSPSQSNNVRMELKKYIVGNSYIIASVYIDKLNGRMYSYNKQYSLKYTGGDVIIHSPAQSFIFSPDQYIDASSGRLIYLESDGEYCLIYFPVNHSYFNYTSFFILDASLLSDVCQSLISNTVSECIITDGNHVFGSSGMRSVLSKGFINETGIVPFENYSSLCISNAFAGGLRICALTSGQALGASISAALYNCLPVLTLLIALGFILVFGITNLTYKPLHKLAARMKDESITQNDPLRILDMAMSQQKNRSIDLEEKIDYYRTLIKKSVLDSIMSASGKSSEDIHNFDYLFAPNADYAIAVLACDASFSASVSGLFDPDIDAGVLSRNDETVFLLISGIKNESVTENNLESMVLEALECANARFALSSVSTSVLDMPRLYSQAEKLYPCTSDEKRIVSWKDYNGDTPVNDNFEYPNDRISAFENALRSCEFSFAQSALNEIFDLLDAIPVKNDTIPDFFIRNVLIDLLSVLTICMNDAKIAFTDFENPYLETLYLCRSCAYETEKKSIRSHFAEMIRIFEKKTGAVSVPPKMIELIVKENLSNPDFGITNIYDKYDISIAYMSYLFKKEIGVGFSDYVWKMRFEKACELLAERKLSVDEVSLAVGYLHSSSFRRKFKQETGLSPTEYITEHTPKPESAVGAETLY